MDSLPAPTQDEVRVGACESVLDIGCGGGETALDLARAVALDKGGDQPA